MKICSKCGEAKPLSGFYRNRRYADGYQGVCKNCQTTAGQNIRKSNGNAASIKYRASNQFKRNVHQLVYSALKKGVITKQCCECCGTSTNIEAHHEKYTKPLDVHWLCREHHTWWHSLQRKAGA